jgi:general secretion pathway protein F
MPQYSYKAKAGPSDIKTGTIQAENQLVVIKKLKAEGLFPILITEINVVPKKQSSKKISSSDISAFTRQLSNLIRSGFAIANALATLAQQAQSSNIKKLIQDLQEKIQKGSTFSDALSAYPNMFSSFYINMVKIGETSGKIEETLERLADFKEREEELVSQVKAALAYPTFLLVVGIITIFILMTFFIPRLVVMFADFGQVLPLATQIIIQTSTFMNRFWWLFVVVAGVLFVFIKSYYKTERNRLVVDSFVLNFPLVRSIIQRMEIARFAYALGVLLKSGVPVLESLGVVSLSVDNRLFRKKIFGFTEKIRQGMSLSSCLQADSLFPPILTNMVAVGEESGELPEMLFRIAATFETEVNRSVKTIVSLIEPALILFMGGFVVLLVLAILLPIFNLNFLSK